VPAIRQIAASACSMTAIKSSASSIPEFLERIRAWTSVPVIILSVRAGATEKVNLSDEGGGLHSGTGRSGAVGH
jgi:hypothetical protein